MIWCGYSDDGLTFHMDPKPVIVPGPEPIDAGGVEDPTVVQNNDGLMVYYTGVQADRRQGSMLLASGPDPYSLKKREVIFKAPAGEGNFKEATLLQAPDKSCECITDRGVEPLLLPPPASDREATDIAFAASAVLQPDGLIHLYYSLEDRKLSRAIVRAYD